MFVDSSYHVLPSGRSGIILTGAILFDKERRNLMCKVLLGASPVAAEILTKGKPSLTYTKESSTSSLCKFSIPLVE